MESYLRLVQSCLALANITPFCSLISIHLVWIDGPWCSHYSPPALRLLLARKLPHTTSIRQEMHYKPEWERNNCEYPDDDEQYEHLRTTKTESCPGFNQCSLKQEAIKTDIAVLDVCQIPSAREISRLEPVGFEGLLPGHARAAWKVIYLKVQLVSLLNGMTLSVRDFQGRLGVVWSLVEDPVLGGKGSLSSGTIIAVKEPYYNISVNGDLAACVHHPSDIVHISKFDRTAQDLFGTTLEDYTSLHIAAGSLFLDGRLVDAVHVYSECIKRARAGPGPDNHSFISLGDLLAKRAFVYTRLKLHMQGLEDAAEVLRLGPNNQVALRLACPLRCGIGKIRPCPCVHPASEHKWTLWQSQLANSCESAFENTTSERCM